MKRSYIKELKRQVGKKIEIAGWVQTKRDQGAITFILVRDVSGLVQVVFSKPSAKISKQLEEITLESVISVTGTVKEEAQAPGGLEISVEKIEILSHAEAGLPIPVIEKGKDKVSQRNRLDWRWLDLRKPETHLIFKVWTVMEQAFVNYCTEHEYTRIHSPKFMSTPSESGAELFEVEYFERKAYLAQSPQFYKQMGMAAGFEKVFEMGPVFRANPSFTSRHDTEFTGYDIEISFIKSHQDVIAEEERFIVAMLKAVKKKYGKEIEEQYGRKLIVPTIPFPQVTMKKAKVILKKLKVESEKEGDLSPEEERRLSKYIKEKEGHEFVFVTEYPVDVRPFYHMRLESDPTLTKSFDLLWNGIEITTGAQREHRYDVLVKQAKEKGYRLEPLKHYLNFFKYGCPPHGGLGFGPSRFLMKIFNLKNVREVTYLYRGVNRLTP
jgi:aspartyl-tRNA synthetase